MNKKLICITLCLCLFCTMLPIPVLAVEVIQCFDVIGLTLPIDGQSPDFTADIIQEDSCKITQVRWLDLWTDNWMDSDDRFVKETDEYGNQHDYRVEITIELLEGNVASGNQWYVTVNGSATATEYEFTAYSLNNDRTKLVIEGDYLPTGHTCSGGYATCISPAICSTCGKAYGSPNPENHDLYGYKKAKDDSKYTTHHDVTCDLCKETLYEEEHDLGPLTERDTRYCIICWYETEPESESSEHTCSGGYATCISPAICSTCGKAYGSPNPENHDLYGYKKAKDDSKYTTHHDVTCDLCKETLYEEEHYLGPLTERDTRYCIVCWYETEPIDMDPSIKFNHTLDLASDISANFVIPSTLVQGYDMSTAYVEFTVNEYTGNTVTGTKTIPVAPVLNGYFYYFTFTGLNAVMMNDDITAVFYGMKDGVFYKSKPDIYSVADYAVAQMNNAARAESLKILCADLLRYGSTAQSFKGYRTDALVGNIMTEAHKAFLSDGENVKFDSYNSTTTDIANPTVTFAGKSLLLDSKVTLRYIVNLAGYTGVPEDLSLVVNYKDLSGNEKTCTLTNIAVYNPTIEQYCFDFDGLLAAELRQPVSVAVYKGSTRLSPTLTYSASTYGNNKTGILLTLCKHLMAYSDSAKAYFQG